MRNIIIALTTISLSACTIVWDDDAPVVELVGQAPALASFPRLNRAPASRAYITQDIADKSYWAVFWENRTVVRAVRLAEPAAELTYAPKELYLRYRALYLAGDWKAAQADGKPLVVTIVNPGQSEKNGARIELPAREYEFYISGPNDEIFIPWPTFDTTEAPPSQIDVFHRDGRKLRTIPIGARPAPPPGTRYSFSLLLTSAGDRVIVRAPEGGVTSYRTDEKSTKPDVELGVHPPFLWLDEWHGRQLVAGGKAGIYTVPLDGSKGRTLDPTPFDPSVDDMWWWGDDLYFLRKGDIFRTSFVEETQPQVMVGGKGAQRLLDIGPDNEVVYSTDGWDKYLGGSGDGRIGDWRFMERGLDTQFSWDGTRIRWLDYTAKAGNIGDLFVSALPKDGVTPAAPVRLARNVRFYGEIADGRVLAIENRAVRGTQARLVAIDEQKRKAQWVCPAADRWNRIPNSTDLLVDAISGASGLDIVRVPLPPPLP